MRYIILWVMVSFSEMVITASSIIFFGDNLVAIILMSSILGLFVLVLSWLLVGRILRGEWGALFGLFLTFLIAYMGFMGFTLGWDYVAQQAYTILTGAPPLPSPRDADYRIVETWYRLLELVLRILAI